MIFTAYILATASSHATYSERLFSKRCKTQVDALENCSEAQKKELEEYISMPAEERASMLDKLKDELKTAESKHEALLKELQATYKESMDALEKLKETSAPKIKLLKAASPAPKAAETAAPKDEV